MIEELKRKIQPLYETNDLLGITVLNDHGGMLHNESFLSDEAARRSAAVFMMTRQNLLSSGRKLKRLIVELDDVILFYCLTQLGHTVFTLDRECDLDVAADLLIPE